MYTKEAYALFCILVHGFVECRRQICIYSYLDPLGSAPVCSQIILAPIPRASRKNSGSDQKKNGAVRIRSRVHRAVVTPGKYLQYILGVSEDFLAKMFCDLSFVTVVDQMVLWVQ